MTSLFKIATSLALFTTILSTTYGETPVTPKVVQNAQGFTVIGISVRTNNAREQTPEGAIGKQWQRFFQEGLLGKIPNKTDSNIIAAYTQYAGDHTGDYTFVLGARVSSDKEIPKGMVAVKVPSGKYAVFTSEKGPAYKVVPATWWHINSLPKSSTGGDRLYQTDFEVYDQRAADPANSQVDVYVGIK
jgi:predicted transcriptional regulator YdeE